MTTDRDQQNAVSSRDISGETSHPSPSSRPLASVPLPRVFARHKDTEKPPHPRPGSPHRPEATFPSPDTQPLTPSLPLNMTLSNHPRFAPVETIPQLDCSLPRPAGSTERGQQACDPDGRASTAATGDGGRHGRRAADREDTEKGPGAGQGHPGLRPVQEVSCVEP